MHLVLEQTQNLCLFCSETLLGGLGGGGVPVHLEEELAVVQGGCETLSSMDVRAAGHSPRPPDGSVVLSGWVSHSWGPGIL